MSSLIWSRLNRPSNLWASLGIFKSCVLEKNLQKLVSPREVGSSPRPIRELRQPLDIRLCGQSEKRDAESARAATADKMLDLYPSPQIIPSNLRRSLTQHLRFDSSSHQPAVQRGFQQEGRPVTAAAKARKSSSFFGI